MYRRLAGLLCGLFLGQSAGVGPASAAVPPVAWSPNGQWLAFVTQGRSDSLLPPLGWSLELTNLVDFGPAGDAADPSKPLPEAWTIWAYRPDLSKYVSIVESTVPVSAPSWRPDGKAIAFGRLVPEDKNRSRFEVVVQDALRQEHVVLKEMIDVASVKPTEFGMISMVWSPDGQYLVVPVFHQTRGLAIMRADNGRILKTLEEAQWPAWSADSVKLTYLGGQEADSLHYIDNNFGSPHQIADVGKVLQPPVWSKQAIILLVRSSKVELRGGPKPSSSLLRFPIDGGKPEPLVLNIEVNRRDRSGVINAASIDRDAENVFLAEEVAGPMSEITWFRPRSRETLKRFNPVEHPIQLTALSLSPNEKNLAFRTGGMAPFQPLGFCDVTERGCTLLLPDDSARIEWLMTLITGVRQLLTVALPPAVDPSGHLQERPSPLPIPGELPMNHESLMRLRNLSRQGLVACERPKEATSGSPALENFFNESRLLFQYLSDDYKGALNSLETVEAAIDDPDVRLRLLSIRAQVYLALGDVERAQETISYLRAVSRNTSRRVEETPAGLSMEDDSAQTHGWPEILAQRVKRLADLKAQSRGDDDNSAETGLLGVQRPAVPFGLQDNGPFQGGGPPQAELVPLRHDNGNVRPGEFGGPRRLVPIPPRARQVPPIPRPIPPRRAVPVNPPR